MSSSTPPDDTAGVRIVTRPNVAGGLTAIAETLAHVRGGPGLVTGSRVLRQLNQPDGFDCPGCAWPEPAPDDRSAFEFCENGAKAVAWETDRGRVDAAFFGRHTVAELAAQSDHWLGQQGRIVEPVWLPEGSDRYRSIGWDEAFALVARTLAGLEGPDQAAFYTSGRTSNEAAFLYQLFVRALGTNNLPDCSNLCHESSGVALKQALGVGKGTVQLEDFALADVILVIGQNPGTNHPRMMTTLQAAARRGCQIVSINPLPELALSRFAHPQSPLETLGGGTQIACLHLPVRVGGDVALLKGVAKELLEDEVRGRGRGVDWPFVERFTEGFEPFAQALRDEPWDRLIVESGIPRAGMRELASMLGGTHRIVACWAMGLTQHEHAIANIQEIVNLLLLRGALGRPGAGVCPVRGHSNVQGDRTMGIDHRPDPALLDAIERRYRFAPPRAHGIDVVGTIEGMEAGRVRTLFALGGNFLSAAPDTERTARALQGCLLTAHVSTKLNRAHLTTGRQALILPCLGRTERDVQVAGPQFVTVEDSMGIVHRSRGVLPPAGPALRSEPAIVAGLAEAALSAQPSTGSIRWAWLVENYDRIRDEIAAVIPGFEAMNERVRAPGGFPLENPVRQGRYPTPSGRARFSVHPVPPNRVGPRQLLLTTIRSHDQYNTTIYGLDDRYRGIRGGRRVVLLNEDDIRELSLAPGMIVDLTSHYRDETRTAPRFVVVPYPIPRGSAAAYFPEANPLVPLGQFAPGSRTPGSKSVVIEVKPSIGGPSP